MKIGVVCGTMSEFFDFCRMIELTDIVVEKRQVRLATVDGGCYIYVPSSDSSRGIRLDQLIFYGTWQYKCTISTYYDVLIRFLVSSDLPREFRDEYLIQHIESDK